MYDKIRSGWRRFWDFIRGIYHEVDSMICEIMNTTAEWNRGCYSGLASFFYDGDKPLWLRKLAAGLWRFGGPLLLLIGFLLGSPTMFATGIVLTIFYILLEYVVGVDETASSYC